ncbi:MAG: hypothetical protein H0V66_06055 [Bdellovibrionales bacterium]|nr:hypothetical protein [Bdellovibrionales bacterium]
MTNTKFCVTREKHLDHMVRVVPFIVCAYAIQGYFIMQLGPVDFAVEGLFFLAGCLISMISGFIIYDMTHIVTFEEETFSVSIQWLNYHKVYAYQDITQIEVSESGQTFASLALTTHSGKKFGFYFVDEADKIKAWLEKKRLPEMQAAA